MNARIMLFHVELNKIGAELRRRFSGKDWSQLRLKQEAESWFYSQIKDNKFGGTIEVQGELRWKDVKQIIVKEEWFFDSKRSVLEVI